MRSNQNSGQFKKYEIKQPPNFINFYKKMDQEKNKQIIRKAQQNVAATSRSMSSSNASFRSNASSIDKFKRSNFTENGKSSSTAASSIKGVRSAINQTNFDLSKYSQYKSNTKNVFYEDRQEVKFVKIFQTVQPTINIVFGVLFLFWLMLYFINGYKGVCPQNAECGVYIHCQKGYELKNNLCIISQQSKDQATYVCQSVIENLKVDYGNLQCQGQEFKPIPRKSLSQIIDQFQLNSKATIDEIQNWLQDSSKQKKYEFEYRSGNVIPMSKKYSVFCQFQKIVQIKGFYLYFTLFCFTIFAGLLFYKYQSEKARANSIYEYLKRRVNNERDVIINVEQITKKFGRIYSTLWENVERHRIQDKHIAFYEDQNLHWRLI